MKKGTLTSYQANTFFKKNIKIYFKAAMHLEMGEHKVLILQIISLSFKRISSQLLEVITILILNESLCKKLNLFHQHNK